MASGIRTTTEQFIAKANFIHSNKYNYLKTEYSNSRSKIIVTCFEHGDFLQEANSHLKGHGCPRCKVDNFVQRISMTQEEWLNSAAKTHCNKYDYSKVEYILSTEKVKIICPIHGEFSQQAHSHLQGIGCRKCGMDISSKKQRSNILDFVSKSKAIHLNKYDYSKCLYIRSHEKVEIVCNKCKKSFWQKPNVHLNGSGCPICQESRGEFIIRNYLESNMIEYKAQWWFKDNENPCRNIDTGFALKFDFYLPNFNVCIEFDGFQHYKPASWASDKSEKMKLGNLESIKRRDQIKNNYCKDNAIKLLRIPYWKIKNIKNILDKEIVICQ